MKRDLICIVCPKGCSLVADDSTGEIKVTGNTCPKGEKYAIDECTHPTRTVTSIVRVSNREDTMVSVKTSCPIPKENIFDVMEILRSITVEAPVKIGQVLRTDVFGADILVTKEIG